MSDDDDVIPIITQPEIIDLTGETATEEVRTPEYEKHQRKAHINKIFSSSSSDKPTTDPSSPQHPRDIGGVRVHLPVIPYRCQINVMSKVIRAIDMQYKCLVESPTGTGKTLALLCASLAWQKRERERIANSVIDNHPKLRPDNQPSPSKPSPSTSSTSITELSFTKKTFGEKSIYDNNGGDANTQFLNRIQQEAGPSSDYPKVLLEDNLVKIHKHNQTNPESPITPEKQAQPESSTPQKNRMNTSLEDTLNNTIESNVSSRLPVIYYGARTHKQLEQVIAEFGKTIYKDNSKMTILSSRENSCIRDFDSNQWESRKAMCRSCIKTTQSTENSINKNTTGCRYFDNRKRLNRDTLPRVFDIEELKKKGKELVACPYYAARGLKENAEIVFCPYNFLIEPNIRNSLRINLEGDIVIIDEGHNIEDTCREAATFSFTIKDIKAALKELNNAVAFRFANNDAMSYIEYLIKALERWEQWFVNQMPLLRKSPLSECQSYVSYEWDMKYFVESLHYHDIGKLQYSEFNRNVSQLSNKLRNSPETIKQVTLTTETLLESLNTVLGYIFGDYMDSYAAILELKFKPSLFRNNEWRASEYDNMSNHEHLKLHLHCMNSAVIFSQLSTARSVVLASGTLTPITSLESELGTIFKIRAIEAHIIPKERVWVGTVGREGLQSLLCTAACMRAAGVRRALGRVLARVCDVTPHGVLCFLPSYAVLNDLVNEWRECGIWNDLQKTKKIFKEANNVRDHEKVMKAYTLAAESECGGAVLLAVYRGKAAEGVDFRDRQARAVVLVGVPFPNKKNPAISQKMKYNDKNKAKMNLLSGSEWYSIQAYRALNQAVGRSVRHVRDWGAVLLLDARYADNKYTDNLSSWARRYLGNNHHDVRTLINNPNGIKAFMEIMMAKEIEENQENVFTLYPAHSRVGRGNLVLRHSVPHVLPDFWKHCVLSGRTQRRA